MAAPTANRSWPCPGRSASALSIAAACGPGIFPSIDSAGRISSSSDPNGICASDSTPRARSSRMPAASRAA